MVAQASSKYCCTDQERAGSFFISVDDDFQTALGDPADWADGFLTPDEIANQPAGSLASNFSTGIQNAICETLGLAPPGGACSDVTITGINLSGGSGRRRVLASVDSPLVDTLTDDSLDLMADPQGASFVRAIRQAVCGSDSCDAVTVSVAA